VEVLADITTEVLAEVATAIVATGVLAEVLAVEVTSELIAELKAWVKIRQPRELKVFNSLRLSVVLLIAIYY
jgi:hypothetical protein